MDTKRQILINAFMSVLQIIVLSIILFILYKYLLHSLGIEQLGIWSLILAATSISQIANFGLAGSVIKYVAKYTAHDDSKKVSQVIQTSFLSLAGFVGIMLILFFPIIKAVLKYFAPETSLPLIYTLLPYAFVSLWLMMLTGTVQAGLDGLQRIDQRAALLILGAGLNLLLCFVLVPSYGLLGVAYARIVQYTVNLIGGWALLKTHVDPLPMIPFNWDKRVFKEIIKYGLNFQIISVTRMLFEPTTKALLSKYGGLASVGYYEMGSKLIIQLRALLVSANHTLVPAIASMKEQIPGRIHEVYRLSYRVMHLLSIPMYTLVLVAFPLISLVWIGSYEHVFISYGILLVLGMLVNTLNVPSYMAYLGIGDLKWNVIGHITTGVLNPALGFIFGLIWGGIGVVAAWALATVAGSSLIFLSYHHKYKIPFRQLFPKESHKLRMTCFTAILFWIAALMRLKPPLIYCLSGSLLCLLAVVISSLFWHHSLRNKILEWARALIKK